MRRRPIHERHQVFPGKQKRQPVIILKYLFLNFYVILSVRPSVRHNPVPNQTRMR